MNIAIILVTFNPNFDELIFNISSYINQVSMIVLVDNSTETTIHEKLHTLNNSNSKIHVISLGANFGIAKAQNVGFNYAVKMGNDFFLEMDQDSALPYNYLDKITNTYKSLLLTNNKFAAIGPIATNKKNGKSYDGFKKNTGLIQVEKTLSSGLFISKDVMDLVGSKDEDLFIDLVDWEWCFRAKKHGLSIFIDTNLQIEHQLGEKHFSFFFLEFGVPKAFRHYYAFRNSLYLFRKRHVPLNWKVRTFFLLITKLCLYPFILHNGVSRLNYMLLGIKHFFQKKTGGLYE